MKIVGHVLVVWALASTAIYSGLVWHRDRNTIVVRPVQMEVVCQKPVAPPINRSWQLRTCVWG